MKRCKLQALAAAFAVLGLVAGCDQPPGGNAPARKATAVDAEANLHQLSFMALSAPMRWDFTEGVLISEAPEVARIGGSKALAMTTTAGTGVHRLGVAGNFAGKSQTYHITIWVKATAGVEVMLEARGQMAPGSAGPADYGRVLLDLDKNAVRAGPLNTPAPNFDNVSVTDDAGWKKLQADMTTGDGWLFVVLGMTAKGEHVFAGKPGQALTIGGLEIAPVAPVADAAAPKTE